MKLELVIAPNRILTTPTEPISYKDVTEDMVDAMFKIMETHNGIGLAAPQVGMSSGFFIAPFKEGRVFISPTFVVTDARKIEMMEGCLSLPGKQILVPRHAGILFRYIDAKGKRREFKATGLKARVIQHEMDHLAGKLITDYEIDVPV